MTGLIYAQSDTTLGTLDTLQMSISAYLPNLAACALVLLIGSLATWLLARLTALLTDRVGLQRAAEQSGLAQSMRDVGITRNLPQILGQVIFYLGLALTVMLALQRLQITEFDETIRRILRYFPNLVFALLVLIFGLMLGKFVRGVVATGADRMGIEYAGTLANVVFVVFLTVLLHQVSTLLGLDLKLFTDLVTIAFCGLMLGMGLAVGLGGREVIAGILAGYYVRKRFQAGDQVIVGELRGTVREVGPVCTVIEEATSGAPRRSIPNTKMLHEAIR